MGFASAMAWMLLVAVGAGDGGPVLVAEQLGALRGGRQVTTVPPAPS